MQTVKASAIRGLMLDPARLTERHEFYFELLPDLAAWGYNTLWLHLTDDEGCALRLRSNPHLPTGYAFTPAEVRRLVSAAGEVGIEVVPEIETLGHSMWITRHEEYAHLLNGDPWGHNALCPSHDDTLELLRPIIEETASLFGGTWFHAGLDEAVFEDCERCRRRARGKPAWWLFAEHAKAVHRLVGACGLRTIMWADAVENNPELLDELPKDIVLAHWHYGEVPAEKIEPSLSAGFEIICVPAVSGEMVQPNASNLQNVQDMVRVAEQLSTKGTVGLVACWWESFRVLRDSVWPALAYAGSSFAARKPVSFSDFASHFTADYFGTDDPAVVHALVKLHELAPGMRELKACYPDCAVDLHRALALVRSEDFRSRSESLEGCEHELQRHRARVSSHMEQYGALLLSARLMAGAYRNASRIAAAYDAADRAADCMDENRPREQLQPLLDEARAAFGALVRETKELAGEAAREWDRTRYARDPKKNGSSPLLRQRGRRAILANLLRSSRYLERLKPAAVSTALGLRLST